MPTTLKLRFQSQILRSNWKLSFAFSNLVLNDLGQRSGSFWVLALRDLRSYSEASGLTLGEIVARAISRFLRATRRNG
jgi:hypothetical protein